MMTFDSKILAAAGMLMLATGAQAEALRFTTAAPASSPSAIAMADMAKRLSTDEDSPVTMEVFPSNQLGDETETIKQVARGRISLGSFSITAAATAVPEVSVVISPYFWKDADEAMCALRNGLSDKLEPYFEKKGIRVVQWTDLGWQIFFAKKDASNPADAVNYKVRVSPAKNHEMFWQAVGASGISLPFAETATGLQTGIVDGGELPLVSYVATGMGKLAPHLILTNHVYQPTVLLMSSRVWKGMSPEEQSAFDAALPDADEVNAELRALDVKLLQKFEAEGGTIHDLTDEQRAQWSALWTEDRQKALVASIGGDAEEIYQAALAARSACRN